MSQNVLKSLLSAAVIAAVSLALPAQGGAAKVERKVPATSDVQVRLAEVIAMLEEDDLTEPQRDAARKKLQEIVEQLRTQQNGQDAAQGRGSMRFRAVQEKEDDDEGGEMDRMKVRRLHPESVTEMEVAEVGEGGRVRRFRVEGHDEGTHVFELRGNEARTAPKAARAPRDPRAPVAPRAPRDPRAPVAPRAPRAPDAPDAPDAPRVEVMEIGGGDAPVARRRIYVADAERATEEAIRAERMAREEVARADEHAKVTMERHRAEAEAEVARARAIEAERWAPNTTLPRKTANKTEKARAPAASDAEVREMIEEMRAEMREIRELMQRIRERSAQSPNSTSENSAK